MGKFIKGDFNQNHCELWIDGEYFGDVRTDDAEKFIGLLNSLDDENQKLKEKISELKCLLQLKKLHDEVDNGKMDKFRELQK